METDSTQAQADFTVVLSSDLISQVMEAYFNSDMFKMPVRVVDLQAKGDAYAFNLAFVKDNEMTEWGISVPVSDSKLAQEVSKLVYNIEQGKADIYDKHVLETATNVKYQPKRSKNGKFASAKAGEE